VRVIGPNSMGLPRCEASRRCSDPIQWLSDDVKEDMGENFRSQSFKVVRTSGPCHHGCPDLPLESRKRRPPARTGGVERRWPVAHVAPTLGEGVAIRSPRSLSEERWSDRDQDLHALGTTEGQTAKIAEYIADVIRGHGHEAHTANIKRSGHAVPDGYDAVIVGASIHMGKHDAHVCDFVRQNLAVLERLPSAFFSVSLAAHGDTAEAENYVEEFEQDTGWRPAVVALFGGALLYTEYGFLKRYVMKKIARDKPGSLGTDTSRDYVYTEWDG
jgi:menaquinone-dependent protoporphyrinogen oxidase